MLLTTKNGIRTDFFISPGEVKFSEKNAEDYIKKIVNAIGGDINEDIVSKLEKITNQKMNYYKADVRDTERIIKIIRSWLFS